MQFVSLKRNELLESVKKKSSIQVSGYRHLRIKSEGNKERINDWHIIYNVNIYIYTLFCVQSHLTLHDPIDCSPLSMGLFWQVYWSELPFFPPGNLPSPGVELMSRVAPALAGRFFTAEPPKC